MDCRLGNGEHNEKIIPGRLAGYASIWPHPLSGPQDKKGLVRGVACV